MEDFKNYLKLNIDSENSRINYLSYMNQFFKTYDKINQDNVNSYLAKCVDEGLKASAFNTKLVSLKHYSKFKKLDIEFPKNKKQNVNESVWLTKDEIEKDLLPYFDCLFNDSKKRILIFRFMFFTGLRINEVANLEKNDFDFINNNITIKNTKGKVDRKVYIHSFILEDIKKEFKKHSNVKNAFNITFIYIRYIIKKINDDLHYYKRFTPHSLRHSCATFLYNNGWTMLELKDFLGHKNIKTTERYVHRDKNEAKEKFMKIKYKI